MPISDCPSGLKHYLCVDYLIVPDLEACHSVWTLPTLLFCSYFASIDIGNKIPDWL